MLTDRRDPRARRRTHRVEAVRATHVGSNEDLLAEGTISAGRLQRDAREDHLGKRTRRHPGPSHAYTQAFRPGIVDLPQDQIRASKNAITFAEQPNDFNFLDWSWTAAPLELTRGLHTVPDSQINLRPATREFGAFNFGRPTVPSIYGRSSPSRHGSQDDSTSHLDSQDFSGVDLGLTGEGDIEMEDVREVRSHMSREGSVGFGKRAPSFDVQDQGDFGGAEMSFEGVDLGLELGDQPELPALEERSRRESES
jgi:cohesin complex subunit SCC1